MDLRCAGTVSGFWIASYLPLARPGQPEAMTNKARIMIAAGVTALFLAGICVAGLAVRGGQGEARTTAAAPSVAKPAPTEAASAEDRAVSAVVDAALAAASGEEVDASAVLDAALAAASGEDTDVSAAVDAVLAAVSGEDHGDD